MLGSKFPVNSRNKKRENPQGFSSTVNPMSDAATSEQCAGCCTHGTDTGLKPHKKYSSRGIKSTGAQIYRNLSEILADRLVRATKRLR